MLRLAPLLLLGVLALASCRYEPPLPDPIDRDLDAIAERDTLVALVATNSTSYFVYRGQPMGFEYDLLRAFARDNDLTFRVRVVSDPDSIFPLLLEGAGDVAAARLKPDTTTTYVAYSRPLYESSPTLVQAHGTAPLPDPVEETIEEGAERADSAADTSPPLDPQFAPSPEPVELRARLIRAPQELTGETVHLPEASPHISRLVELSDSLSGDIHIVEVDGVTPEDLIERVAYGELDLTVSSEALAQLKTDRFENIVAVPTLGSPEEVAWAVRPNAPQLLDAFNEWLMASENEQRVQQAFQRYFIDRKGYRERVESEYLTSATGALSPFDGLFEQYADSIGWDWRLLASQAYQESKFQPAARSWAGAAGLLQLMPPTAREFGTTNVYDPEDNVRGAVRFIQWLENYWTKHIEDEEQRLRFVLASYNTGHGHVEDARRLADKAGLNDTYWPDVAFWLLQKSNPEVYRDPVVRYGYSRGLEPVTYVELILERFDHYRQFHREGAPATAQTAQRESIPLANVRGVR